MTLVYLLILVLLLLMNAFFVLGEFSAVKVRGSQVAELEDQKRAGAGMLRHIHEHLDEYLSVCQLGITFTSVGLGFVGEPAVASLLQKFIHSKATAHALAVTLSYVLVSALHIVLGEQVPKIVAITHPVRTALLVAWPMRVAHRLLYAPLWLLNGCVRLVLWPFGLRTDTKEAGPSEAEVRVILEESQQQGMMPFRRLLLLENVFDFGEVRVRDEMRPIAQMTVLRADRPWEENRDIILNTNHTRYPLLEGDPPRALGIIHIKDLLHQSTPWPSPMDLRSLARKTFMTTPEMPLEQLLTELRRRRIHMALVQTTQNSSLICGLITMEDILEQLVGAIEDEFEKEAPIRLGDVLKETRIVLDVEAGTATTAIEEILKRGSAEDLPIPVPTVIESVKARERSLSTYLGEGLAVPHARLDNLKTPLLYFAHSPNGVVFDPKKPEEKAHLMFLLLTPSASPRIQIRLLARIANLRESNYVWDRLLNATTPAEALEAIRSGDELLTT